MRCKKIWELNVPDSVKVFIWKALSEVLPTKCNLFKRKIIDNSLYPICEQIEETSCHALWSYVAASNVWADSLNSVQKWICREYGFYNIGGNGLCIKVWDTALEVENLKMRARIVIRDVDGELIASISMPQQYVSQSVIAETHALWRAMVLCLEIGLDHYVIFETDALLIIKDVQHQEENWYWYGQMIEDITEECIKKCIRLGIQRIA